MKEEIINRVKKSSLHIINLEDYYPEGKRATLDIKNWLFEDFVLKEIEEFETISAKLDKIIN